MSSSWKDDFYTAFDMRQIQLSNIGSSYKPSEDSLNLVQEILDEAYFAAKEGKKMC